MKGKRKGFVVKVAGSTYTCVEAKVILSDDSRSYQWNHPKVYLKFRLTGDDRDCYRWVVFEFQRESMTYSQYSSKPELDRAVYGRMDTAERWTISYGGHVQIQDLDRLALGYGEINLSNVNKLRCKVNKLVGEAIMEYNLHKVTEDQCEEVALACEKLGVFVEWEYVTTERLHDGTVKIVSLHEIKNAQANERFRKESEPKPEPETTTETAN